MFSYLHPFTLYIFYASHSCHIRRQTARIFPWVWSLSHDYPLIYHQASEPPLMDGIFHWYSPPCTLIDSLIVSYQLFLRFNFAILPAMFFFDTTGLSFLQHLHGIDRGLELFSASVQKRLLFFVSHTTGQRTSDSSLASDLVSRLHIPADLTSKQISYKLSSTRRTNKSSCFFAGLRQVIASWGWRSGESKKGGWPLIYARVGHVSRCL